MKLSQWKYQKVGDLVSCENKQLTGYTGFSNNILMFELTFILQLSIALWDIEQHLPLGQKSCVDIYRVWKNWPQVQPKEKWALKFTLLQYYKISLGFTSFPFLKHSV